jgi:hypothetical protein
MGQGQSLSAIEPGRVSRRRLKNQGQPDPWFRGAQHRVEALQVLIVDGAGPDGLPGTPEALSSRRAGHAVGESRRADVDPSHDEEAQEPGGDPLSAARQGRGDTGQVKRHRGVGVEGGALEQAGARGRHVVDAWLETDAGAVAFAPGDLDDLADVTQTQGMGVG